MNLEENLKSILPLSMLSYFFSSCWVFLVPLILKQLGFFYIEIGLVIAISTFTSIILRLIFGHLADKFGPTIILRISLLGLCFSSLIIFFSSDFISFTVASVFHLFSSGMIYKPLSDHPALSIEKVKMPLHI